MKRGMGGGAHRGPVAPTRQRRTLRFVQGLLVALAVVLLMFAGYSLGKRAGYEEGRRATDFDAPRRPSIAEVVVPGLLGVGVIVGALLLQSQGGIRMPTPARLDELAGRAEDEALERAEKAASQK
ncbi:MAG: hypothetical protein M3280_07255 [Actinomycetota bacterium]|nr:hypothetical protein [Actinomycetota bacterium]